MQTNPEVGKTYQSAADPSLIIFIEELIPSELDPIDNVQTGFFVTGCAPQDKGDIHAIGQEFTQSEWEELRFTLCMTS